MSSIINALISAGTAGILNPLVTALMNRYITGPWEIEQKRKLAEMTALELPKKRQEFIEKTYGPLYAQDYSINPETLSRVMAAFPEIGKEVTQGQKELSQSRYYQAQLPVAEALTDVYKSTVPENIAKGEYYRSQAAKTQKETEWYDKYIQSIIAQHGSFANYHNAMAEKVKEQTEALGVEDKTLRPKIQAVVTYMGQLGKIIESPMVKSDIRTKAMQDYFTYQNMLNQYLGIKPPEVPGTQKPGETKGAVPGAAKPPQTTPSLSTAPIVPIQPGTLPPPGGPLINSGFGRTPIKR